MADEDLKALRAEYKTVLGKKPFNGWDADTLRRHIEAAKAGSPTPDLSELDIENLNAAGAKIRAADAAREKAVKIVVTVNHVYLPLDEHGNGRADWVDAQVTTRVDKRVRLKVPADLAKFLSDRDQVEIL